MAPPPRRSLPLALWRAAALGRCPGCGKTSMFSGYYAMHTQCAHCSLRYETSPGAWLGALAIGYGIGVAGALALVFVELAFRPMRDAGLEPTWTIAALSLVFTAIGYRWAKGIWFALLYRWDFMAYGEAPPGPGPRLE